MKLKNFLTVAVALFLSAAVPKTASADEPRPIVSTYTLEVGGGHALSTYLSPIAYVGPDYGLEGRWRKRMPFDPHRWEMEFRGGVGIMFGHNPSHNANLYNLRMNLSWGMERMWRFSDVAGGKWNLGGGGAAALRFGTLWLPRNGNNPVALRASAGLDLTVSAVREWTLAGHRFAVADRCQLPTFSIFFSPEYGETYYEIYLGNRKGLAHSGWWGNKFGINNLLSAEMQFGKRSLLVGWRLEIDTDHVNNLDTQLWRNAAVVGLTF